MQVVVRVPGQHLALAGRLDAHCVAELRTALHRHVQDGSGDLEVCVDGLENWDATGLGVLLGTQRLADRLGRRVVLVGVPPRVERLLRVTKLHRVLHRRPDPAEVLSA